MPTYNVTNPDGSTLSFKSDQPLDQASIEEVVKSQSGILPKETAATGVLPDSRTEVLKNVLSLLPTPSGEVEAFKEGQKSGNQLFGNNIAGDAAGGALGYVNAIGNLFKPLAKGGSYVANLTQAAGQAAGGDTQGAQDTLTGKQEVLADVKPAMTESTLANFLSDLAVQARKDPINAAQVLEGVRGQIGKLTAPKTLNLDIPAKVQAEQALALTPQEVVQAESGAVPPVIEQPTIPVASNPEQNQGSGVVNRLFGAIPAAIERVAINAEDFKTKQTALSRLPQEQRVAIENGVQPSAVTQITNATPQEAPIFKRMTDAAERFSQDRSQQPHSSIVGEEALKRIEDAKTLQKQIGQRQGELVKQLPKQVTIDASQAALDRMNEVPGLRGITLDNEGNLDFSETALSGPETVAARKSIQANFSALEGKSPAQLHRMRQELFEVLGGKKNAGVQLTSTEEAGLNALRQGAADVIEQMSPEYKNLNQQYAEITQPIKELDKHFRKIDPNAEDLMNTKASVLLRRLTGNAVSGSEIEGLFNDLEAQLANNGVGYGTSLKNLQEFSNTLNQIFPETISRTGFAGQVNAGIPKTLLGVAEKVANKAIGKTPATQQKYFKDLVNQAADRANKSAK